MTLDPPVRCIVIGAGWRAQFFLRLATLIADIDLVGVVVQRESSAADVATQWRVPGYTSLSAALTELKPDFAVVGVPRSEGPGVITELVSAGVPVLAETPPAGDIAALRSLWDSVGASGLVQVAEQYPLYPGHSARLQVVREGIVGRVTSIQVSSTHGYHAVAMIRGFLGAGFQNATVTASSFSAPLVDPVRRDGWTDDFDTHDAETVLATIAFGDSMGLYDFTTNQWHNHLRARRIVVRGSHGEIVDDSVTHLLEARALVRSELVRRQTGYDLDLEGYDTDYISFDGKVVFRNPFVGCRLADDEIAVGRLLLAMAGWCRQQGPPPYSLAEGAQDQLIALAISESLKQGRAVSTGLEAWASQ